MKFDDEHTNERLVIMDNFGKSQAEIYNKLNYKQL